MKLIFICGCLEPGHDGVGDYTRLLASRLIGLDVEVTIFAISDQFTDSIFEGTQSVQGVDVYVWRIPSSMDESLRFSFLSERCADINPDWLSIQFVPFSYHKKGLPFSFASSIKSLTKKCKTHIMFHELWVGASGATILKHKILGLLQKRIIRGLIDEINVNVITTTIDLYKSQLNIPVSVLPLFGNMQIFSFSENTLEQARIQDRFVSVHFGTFSGDLEGLSRQLNFVRDLAAKIGKQPIFRILGSGGRYKAGAIEIAKEILGADSVYDLGILSEKLVSLNLQTSDIGISRADIVFFGKSGSAIAMIEHGLPVVLRGKKPAPTYDFNLEHNDDQILFFDSDFPVTVVKYAMNSGIDKTANTFLKLLRNHKNEELPNS